MRTLKVLVFLLVVGSVGLIGFAYFGNLDPEQDRVSVPIELDAQ